jgi:hypothetical protein
MLRDHDMAGPCPSDSSSQHSTDDVHPSAGCDGPALHFHRFARTVPTLGFGLMTT